MKNNVGRGKVITPAGANPWPHEERIARILALAGHRVEFVPEANIKTPDIYLDRTMYEIKSPISNKVDAVERNITRALMKCPNIIFDSSRMKVRDDQIMKELVKRRKLGKGLRKLLFINKRGMIIDIESLI
jgi:hypothetical protein